MKEKEYLVAFKLYIEHYDPRYRYPKWIKAASKKEAVAKYTAMIKPDTTIGACIIIDERPVKQTETTDTGEEVNLKNIENVYHKGNLKLLELMISQLNKNIDPANPNHTPRPFIIDMDEINKELCSTSRLVNMLSSGVSHDMLPYNGYIYTDDFFEHVNDYMNTRYQYEFYEDYTLIQIRADLQLMYDNYSKHGILPWQDNKEEESDMKENIVKGDRTKEKKPIDVIEYAPQFDISAANINLNFPYILEIDNICTGVRERHVVVITKILINCIYCNQWDNVNETPHSGIVLTASAFHERNAALYKVTGEDLIDQSSDKDSVME